VKAGLVRTFQITSLFNNLTVQQNLYLPISERTGTSSAMWSPASAESSIVDEIGDILARLGLLEDRDRTIIELPYGKRRLLEIGIALSLRPKVLILDEPAAGLRAEDVARMLDVIGRLPADMAMIMVEHDMQVVRRFASRVCASASRCSSSSINSKSFSALPIRPASHARAKMRQRS